MTKKNDTEIYAHVIDKSIILSRTILCGISFICYFFLMIIYFILILQVKFNLCLKKKKDTQETKEIKETKENRDSDNVSENNKNLKKDNKIGLGSTFMFLLTISNFFGCLFEFIFYFLYSEKISKCDDIENNQYKIIFL